MAFPMPRLPPEMKTFLLVKDMITGLMALCKLRFTRKYSLYITLKMTDYDSETKICGAIRKLTIERVNTEEIKSGVYALLNILLPLYVCIVES